MRRRWPTPTTSTTIAAPIDEPVPDGGTVRVGDVRLTAIHLVGHTPGSIALLYDDPTGPPHLFTGDCLFPGGVGNTQKDAERFASLLGDVRDKLFDRLPDETWVYPGHGNDTTLGAERPHLQEWPPAVGRWTGRWAGHGSRVATDLGRLSGGDPQQSSCAGPAAVSWRAPGWVESVAARPGQAETRWPEWGFSGATGSGSSRCAEVGRSTDRQSRPERASDARRAPRG